MAKIVISPGLIIKITITVILMLLVIFANFITIRRLGRYAVEVFVYSKLSVAYDIGGINGVKHELAKIKSDEKLRHELELAAEFERKLDTLKNPEGFIDNALAEGKRKIALLRRLRIIAFALIFLICILRIFVNLKLARSKKV
jgi:hypothetical protein